MAGQIDISKLMGKTPLDRLLEYAEKIPNGKAIRFTEVIRELDISEHVAVKAGLKVGIIFTAAAMATGGFRRMIANPKTVKQWQDAQNKIPPPQR